LTLGTQQTEVAAVPPAPAPSSLRDHLNGSLITGIVVGFLLRCASGATGVLLGFYLNRVVSGSNQAIDPSVIAGLTAAFFVVEFLLAPVFGSWSDSIGRKPFLLVGPIIAGLAVQLHPLTTLLWVIVIGRLLEGLATAATTPGTLGFLSDMTSGHPALRGRVMGLYELGSLVGIGLGPVVGGRLWDFMQQDGLHWVALLDFLAAALVFFFIRESRPAHAGATTAAGKPAVAPTSGWGERLQSYRSLLGLRGLWQFAPAWIAINGVVGLWFNHVTPLLSRGYRNPNQLLEGGWTGSEVSNLFIIFGLALMVGIYFWSHFYARMRKTNIMLMSIGGAFALCVVLFAINMQLLPAPWGAWALLPLVVVAIFFESAFTPVALAYLADLTEGQVQNRGAVMGLYSVFLALGQVLGATIGVPFIDALGFNGLLLATVLLVVVAGGAVLRLRHATGD
jgi:MFS family permease